MQSEPLRLKPPAAVHLIGICGTGMGALAGLLSARGYRVTGSDAHAYPPMSDALTALGITVQQGYSPAHLDHGPDLVVVGNVCTKDHPEAKAAVERGLTCASLPRTLRDLFLVDHKPLVVSGTHGKTTTSALIAFLLHRSGRDPSFFIGGATADFGVGHRLGRGPWFVLEGDEYDSAYFEKVPKFLSYAPHAAIITSIEHDHLDIYPTFEAYQASFQQLVALLPTAGHLVVFAQDERAVGLAQNASCDGVTSYGVDPRYPADWSAEWTGPQTFSLTINGGSVGEWHTPLVGDHNLCNTLAALIICHRVCGVPLAELSEALPSFQGVSRRQQVIGTPNRITIYDDFAHHPTAVEKTLAALALRHPEGRIAALFEPRSATACRALHQQRYAGAFDNAALAVIAPVGRKLPEDERLDTARLALDLRARGIDAVAATDFDEILTIVTNWAEPGDGVVLLSNGDFGGLRHRLVEKLK